MAVQSSCKENVKHCTVLLSQSALRGSNILCTFGILVSVTHHSVHKSVVKTDSNGSRRTPWCNTLCQTTSQGCYWKQ